MMRLMLLAILPLLLSATVADAQISSRTRIEACAQTVTETPDCLLSIARSEAGDSLHKAAESATRRIGIEGNSKIAIRLLPFVDEKTRINLHIARLLALDKEGGRAAIERHIAASPDLAALLATMDPDLVLSVHLPFFALRFKNDLQAGEAALEQEVSDPALRYVLRGTMVGMLTEAGAYDEAIRQVRLLEAANPAGERLTLPGMLALLGRGHLKPSNLAGIIALRMVLDGRVDDAITLLDEFMSDDFQWPRVIDLRFKNVQPDAARSVPHLLDFASRIDNAWTSKKLRIVAWLRLVDADRVDEAEAMLPEIPVEHRSVLVSRHVQAGRYALGKALYLEHVGTEDAFVAAYPEETMAELEASGDVDGMLDFVEMEYRSNKSDLGTGVSNASRHVARIAAEWFWRETAPFPREAVEQRILDWLATLDERERRIFEHSLSSEIDDAALDDPYFERFVRPEILGVRRLCRDLNRALSAGHDIMLAFWASVSQDWWLCFNDRRHNNSTFWAWLPDLELEALMASEHQSIRYSAVTEWLQRRMRSLDREGYLAAVRARDMDGAATHAVRKWIEADLADGRPRDAIRLIVELPAGEQRAVAALHIWAEQWQP